MDFQNENLYDQDFFDDEEEIKSIAKKSWLSSASAQLANLDNVKAKVYNFGMVDAKDLKATNLSIRKPTDREATISQANDVAWGSNGSIPDLLKQQRGETSLKKGSRPASAKYSQKLRPPSGRKARPQSAKEPIEETPASQAEATFGVKGAKYDPSGRPPKGVPQGAGLGWVGPPAGLKYPDKPQTGKGWKIDFPEAGEDLAPSLGLTDPPDYEVPPPPQGTPIPSPEPEKQKRVFDLYIGDPYSTENNEDYYEDEDWDDNHSHEIVSDAIQDVTCGPKDASDDNYEEGEEELHFGYTHNIRSTHNGLVGVNFSQSPAPQSHVGPTPDNGNYANDYTSHTPSDRSHTPGSRPSSGVSESLKLSLPMMEDDYDEADDMDTERLLAEAESVSKQFDLASVIKANKQATGDSDQSLDEPCTENINENKQKAETLVSKIISENGLTFDKRKPKGEKQGKPFLEIEKSQVKFDDTIKTVNITPRNIGRKVEELHHSKKKAVHHTTDNFVDLIEVKNRIEPVLSTGRAELSDKKKLSRPPSGKSHITESKLQQQQGVKSKPDPYSKHERQAPITNCTKPHPPPMSRPRSASGPMNRAAKPITTVTVDYGIEEQEKKAKTKKSTQKYEEIPTMMEKIPMTQDNGNIEEVVDIDFSASVFAPTVCKSVPEKNYYEISRHSSMSTEEVYSLCSKQKPASQTPAETKVYKTTKTLEFDEVGPREVSVKSALDPVSVPQKDKERFTSTPPPTKESTRGRQLTRPASAKPAVSRKPSTEGEGRSLSQERPGSRLGFVAMTPGKSLQEKPKTVTRPASAPVSRRPKSAQRDKENLSKMKAARDKKANGDAINPLTQAEREEQEKVIDNLIERTKSLVAEAEESVLVATENANNVEASQTSQASTNQKKVRPGSAHVGNVSKMKEQIEAKIVSNRLRPSSASTSGHKHYANYSSGIKHRKSSAKKTRTVLTEPCIINTKTDYFEDEETEVDLECKALQAELSRKGVNIGADTLQRALYPPAGRTKYYQITADLPKTPSLSLLSHPKVWLPYEYSRLQKAEKALDKANEIMFMQEKADRRKAMLEELGEDGLKKLKKKAKKGGKKGKKGVKKVRKQTSVG